MSSHRQLPTTDPQHLACRQILDEVDAFVYTTDLQGRYVYANRLVLDLLGDGLELEDVVGKSFTDFVAIDEDAELREVDVRVMQHGETLAREETNLIHATGELRTYWSIKKPLRDASGAIIGMIGISHDITEKKRLEDKVRHQKELLDAVLDNVDALVYMKGADRRFLYANPKLAEVFNRPAADIIGRLDSELMPQEAADRFWEQDCRILASGQRHVAEESLPDASGRLRHYWSVIVPGTSPAGEQALIGLSTDITELHELKEELQRQAKLDSLTGIANRRTFFDRADDEFARCRSEGIPLSLIAIDLDHFKQINDRFGHPTGDAVLQDFTGCCSSILRKDDLFARTGGEEFCILLPATSASTARTLAERIRTMTSACRPCPDNLLVHMTVSLGVTAMQNDDPNFSALFSRADRALYAAKQRGRDCVVTLDPA